MTVRTMPDMELILSGWLKDQTEVTAILGTRIVTEWGKRQEWPALRITEIGGSVPDAFTYSALTVLVQFDILGGAKKTARDAALAVHSVLAAQVPCRMTVGEATAMVHNVDLGGLRSGSDRRPGPDASVDGDARPAAKPLVSFDATFRVTP